MEQRLFIAIVSCQRNSSRRQICRETWLSLLNNPNVEYKFFIGGQEVELTEPDVVHLYCDDSHALLLDKHYYIYKHCLENYDFDKFLCVDDDTYVWVDEMYKVAQTEDRCMANRKDSYENRTVYGGGGRYIPKNWLIEYTNWLSINRGKHHGYPDDVIMGKVFDKLGIPCVDVWSKMIWHPAKLEWLQPWYTWCCTPIDNMRHAHVMVTSRADAYMYVIARHWQDILGFLKDGTLLKYGYHAGKYRVTKNELVLEWNDDNVTILQKADEDLYATKNMLIQPHGNHPALSSL